MTDDEIKTAIQTAIEAIKLETPQLAFGSVHERATAHRLAVQMETPFTGWNVDCEYDRDGLIKKELLGSSECSNERTTDYIFPDIIVHHRGDGGSANNLLVIELKKSAEEDPCDKKKLELFTADKGHYKYQLGLYININNGKFKCTWYKNGIKQTP